MAYGRKDLEAFPGYIPGTQPSQKDIVKLNTNENPYPPSPAVERFLRGCDPALLRRYPQSMCDDLRDQAEKTFGVPRENILAGNGSDDLLTMIFRAFLTPRDTAVTAAPTYTLYRDLAVIRGCGFQTVQRNSAYGLPPELTQTDAAVYLAANPNSPTGTLSDSQELKSLAEKISGILVIDEAYADFSASNALELYSLPNVIVLRTLSKSFSLAGIRLGFAFASNPLIREMIKVKDSYNVNMLTQRIGIEALKDRQWALNNIRKIIDEREKAVQKFKAMGWKPSPSEANFIWVRPSGRPAGEIHQSLLEKNILVRYFSGPDTGNHLRITVGTPGEMHRLFHAIKETNHG